MNELKAEAGPAGVNIVLADEPSPAAIRVTYEPGDGSFEVVIGEHDPFPKEWNLPCAAIYREVAADTNAGGRVLLKALGTTL